MAWKQITEITEDMEETETESTETAEAKSDLCECVCEIRNLLKSIDNKLSGEGTGEIIYNQRKHR